METPDISKQINIFKLSTFAGKKLIIICVGGVSATIGLPVWNTDWEWSISCQSNCLVQNFNWGKMYKIQSTGITVMFQLFITIYAFISQTIRKVENLIDFNWLLPVLVLTEVYGIPVLLKFVSTVCVYAETPDVCGLFPLFRFNFLSSWSRKLLP